MSNRKDIDSFISTQPSMREPVLYVFEPVPGDTMSTIAAGSDSDLAMDKCARKWAMRFVEGESAHKKLVEQLDGLVLQTSEVVLEVTSFSPDCTHLITYIISGNELTRPA